VYVIVKKELVGAPGSEPGTSCAQGKLGKGISLILRHGWRPKSTQNHVWNAEVVPILYSFEPLGNAKTVLHGIHCLPYHQRRRCLRYIRWRKSSRSTSPEFIPVSEAMSIYPAVSSPRSCCPTKGALARGIQHARYRRPGKALA